MKQYRLEYDKTFIARSKEGKPLILGDEEITDISIYFRYRVFDRKTGREVFFACRDDEEPKEQTVEGHSLNAFWQCAYNRTMGYAMIPTNTNTKSNYRVDYEISGCFKGVIRKGHEEVLAGVTISQSEELPYAECIKLLKDYPEHFDTSTNKSAQSCAYGVELIKE